MTNKLIERWAIYGIFVGAACGIVFGVAYTLVFS